MTWICLFTNADAIMSVRTERSELMKKGYKRCLVLCILMLLFCGCGKKEAPENADAGLGMQEDSLQSEDTTEADDSREEEQLSFEGQDTEGNSISSSVLSESKLTMINVWATYCNPCLREMPGLGELAKEYDSGDFQIIGIISDVQEGASEKTLEYALSLIEQTGADYPHLLLNEALYRALLTEVSAVPTTFFFNDKGELLDVVVGSMEKSAWEEKINGLLEKD